MRKLICVLLAVLMMAGFATVAFATDVPSPTEPTIQHLVEVIYHIDPPYSAGTVRLDDGEVYQFTAREFEGLEFDRFEIEGEYVIEYENGTTIWVRPLSDIVIHVYFKDVPPQDDPHDHGPDSPHTADNTVWILAVMALGLFGAFVAGKKLIREN